MTPFILFPGGYGPAHRNVQIVTRSRRVAQRLPVDRPFVGATTKKELQRERENMERGFGNFGWGYSAGVMNKSVEGGFLASLRDLHPERE